MTAPDLGPQVTFDLQEPQVHVQITEPGIQYRTDGLSAGFSVDSPTLNASADDPAVEVTGAEYTYRPQAVGSASLREARLVVTEQDTALILPHDPQLQGMHLFVNGLAQRPGDWSYAPDTRTVRFHDHTLYPGDELSLLYTPEYL